MPPRPVIYQLFVRLFSNDCANPVLNGALEHNGCGKFNDIDDAALDLISAMGFTHIWLTGVLEQASATAYPGRPADDPAVVKGVAGSPYAIRDYFDVCPDYAVEPANRLAEFTALLERCRRHNLKPLIDFVPNHVARTYASDVRPDLSFGSGDDTSVFFARDNHFFYLRPTEYGGPPMRLPAPNDSTREFTPEATIGKVTGNNAATWAPSITDWYETIKLNYGHDYTTGRDTSHLPPPETFPEAVPRTWRTMDQILGYWQELGVAGFRVDMAHMVPLEFWHWVIKRCRDRDSAVYIFGEAYDSDPMKLTDGDVLAGLLEAGFDAVYDHPSYKLLKGLYESGRWANDLDPAALTERQLHQTLRYAENHDEVRLASPLHWGGLGMKVSRPVSAVLLTLGRGPVMIYNGQEVGEPALDRMGFGGGDGRTSIFDYGVIPQLVNERIGRLDWPRQELRGWYVRLLHLLPEPAFSNGEFYGLNHANLYHPGFGQLWDETCSGHWLFAFLRHDPASGQTFLVVANFHGTETLANVSVLLPAHAIDWFGRGGESSLRFEERLAGPWSHVVATGDLSGQGLPLGDLPPCSVRVIEIGAAGAERSFPGPETPVTGVSTPPLVI